jgi:hypothetical protein
VLAATVIGLLAPRSEAAIITGDITGGFQDYNNLGSVIPYHATYRYDDANWTSVDSSDQDYTKIKYRAPLEYFSYSSVGYGGYGSTNILGLDYIEVEDTYDSNPPSPADQAWNEFNRRIYFSANILPGNFLAFADLTISRSNSQVGPLLSLAGLSTVGSGWAFSYSQNLIDIRPNPLGVTSVPTPALLPGLVGFGVGLLRRRKLAAYQV